MIQNYENRLADQAAKHNIEMYEKENELQNLLTQKETEAKYKLK